MSTNTPTLYAYTVRNRGKGQSAIWTRCGAAWAHNRDGKLGYSIELDSMPVNGRLVLIEPKTAEAADAAEPAEASA